MFGFSKEEKQKKAITNALNELNTILTAASNQGWLARSNGGVISGGYDNADDLHNIFEDFGYPHQLDFDNFWNMYRRHGIAARIVNLPVEVCWMDIPELDGGQTFNSQFEELVKKLKLWKRLRGLDQRQRVGRYAGLFVRVKDGKKPSQPIESLNGLNSVQSLTPIYEGQLEVTETEQDETDPRFGLPTMYTYNASGTGSRSTKNNVSMVIHWSRIITAAEGADDGSIYGIPSFENCYNDLMDIRKICGAGGEGFYQNTRMAPVINTKEGFSAPEGDVKTALEEQLDEWIGKWRKHFMSQGLELQFPDITLDRPKEFYDNSLNNCAAGSGIPAKFLIGQQTGKLAADEDSQHFLMTMNSRRENFLNDVIESVIDWFVEYNVIAEPTNLTIEWSDLLAKSDDEKLDLSEKMAAVNEKQFRAGGMAVFSEEEIREAGGYEPEDLPEPDEGLDDDEQERSDEPETDPSESDEGI